MDMYFPFKTITRQEPDPPWINRKTKRLIKKHRTVYDREGTLCGRVSDKIIRSWATVYWDTQRQTLLSPGRVELSQKM